MGKKKEMEEGGGSWMDTYGDMVTLLFTFFVMLYSMSSVNEEKWAMLVRAFNIHAKEQVDQIVVNYESDPGGSQPFDNINDGNAYGENLEELTTTMDELFISINKYVEEHDMGENIDVRQEESSSESSNSSSGMGTDAKNIYIQFKNDVLFMPDQSVLRDEAVDVIDFLGKCLGSVEEDIAMVIIKGHTAVGKTSVVDSRLLSSDRASTISNILEKDFKIPSTKLYPIGLSGDYPIASNDTEDGRRQNRRVEIVIISKNSAFVQSGELMKILGSSFTTGEGEAVDVAVDDVMGE